MGISNKTGSNMFGHLNDRDQESLFRLVGASFATLSDDTAAGKLRYCELGMTSEHGEVADLACKSMRLGTVIDDRAWFKELGDVLYWQAATYWVMDGLLDQVSGRCIASGYFNNTIDAVTLCPASALSLFQKYCPNAARYSTYEISRMALAAVVRKLNSRLHNGSYLKRHDEPDQS
jgi:hypothetical protein